MQSTKVLYYPIAVKKAVSPLAICLGSLYNDELTQNLVRTVVGDQFDALFNQYVNDAIKKKIKVHNMYEKRLTMKSLFVEFGLPLESVDDLLVLTELADQFDKVPREISYFDLNDSSIKTVKIKTDFADPNGKPKPPTLLDVNGEDTDEGCDVVDA
jgi:hypothetical protein